MVATLTRSNQCKGLFWAQQSSVFDSASSKHVLEHFSVEVRVESMYENDTQRKRDKSKLAMTFKKKFSEKIGTGREWQLLWSILK